MVVATGKRFKKNNVYIFRRYKKKPIYMACILCDKDTACFVPIQGARAGDKSAYKLDLEKPELLTNDIPLNSAIDIERYGWFGDGEYWSYESV